MSIKIGQFSFEMTFEITISKVISRVECVKHEVKHTFHFLNDLWNELWNCYFRSHFKSESPGILALFGALSGYARWSYMTADAQMTPDDPRWSQMIPDDASWAKLSPDDARWIQKIPDDLKSYQMSPDELSWSQINSDEGRCLGWVQMIPGEPSRVMRPSVVICPDVFFVRVLHLLLLNRIWLAKTATSWWEFLIFNHLKTCFFTVQSPVGFNHQCGDLLYYLHKLTIKITQQLPEFSQ